MPSLEWNQTEFGKDYDWSKQGEEWSARWSDSESQWWGSIFPRIHAFLPTHTILELAPGYGRWTNFLKDLSQELIVVDLSAKCIDVCKQRFATSRHIAYHVNDGKSLSMVRDESLDFVFSFDSLVHAEADVVKGYLGQLAKKLKRDGAAFIHHSNLAEYSAYFRWTQWTKRLPRGRMFLIRSGILDKDHWRGQSMSASLFEQQCLEVGLCCLSQELVNWNTKRLIDCMTLFCRADSNWVRPNRILRNADFMKEADLILQTSRLFAVSKNGNERRAKLSNGL